MGLMVKWDWKYALLVNVNEIKLVKGYVSNKTKIKTHSVTTALFYLCKTQLPCRKRRNGSFGWIHVRSIFQRKPQYVSNWLENLIFSK